MKKAKTKPAFAPTASTDEVLLEYDFSRSRPNKFTSRFQAGSAVVVLDPDTAAISPRVTEANEALLAQASVIRKSRSKPGSVSRDVKVL